MRLAVNYLDDSNFPNGLNGTLINDYTIPLKKLGGMEIQHTIFGLGQILNVNSTTLINVGGMVVWDTIWGSNVNLTFEVVGGASNASYPVTFELHGLGGKLAEVTSNKAVIEVLRSESFSPPQVGQTLLVKVKTAHSSYPVQILSARLIIKIN